VAIRLSDIKRHGPTRGPGLLTSKTIAHCHRMLFSADCSPLDAAVAIRQVKEIQIRVKGLCLASIVKRKDSYVPTRSICGLERGLELMFRYDECPAVDPAWVALARAQVSITTWATIGYGTANNWGNLETGVLTDRKGEVEEMALHVP
jgi:hypothetical protein